MGFDPSQPCPCHSSKPYLLCCKPFHDKVSNPQNALLLMRSRYSAYALNIADYIIATTHPKNVTYKRDRNQWMGEIGQFSLATQFTGLEILDFTEEGMTAYVTFKALLSQSGADCSFIEKSRFERVNGLWLYRAGEKVV